MPRINCFDNSIPELKDKFDGMVTGEMSEQEQREIGTKLAVDYHKQLHDELNVFRKQIGVKGKAYTSPDKSEVIKGVKDKYQKLIEDHGKRIEQIGDQKNEQADNAQLGRETNETVTTETGTEQQRSESRDSGSAEVKRSEPVSIDTSEKQGSENNGGDAVANYASEEKKSEQPIQTKPPVPPTVEKTESQDDSDKTRTLKIARRILDSDANPAIKRGIKEKGAGYIPKSINITDKEANDLIELYGDDKAELIVRDTKNDLTGDTRTAIAARLYEKYKREADESNDPQVKAEKYDKAVDIALTSAEQLKESGRQVNAAKIWKAITASEDMTVMAIEKEHQRQAKKLTDPIQPQIDEAHMEFDEQIRRLIAKKVTEGVEQQLSRAKLITAERKKKITDAFEKLKVKDVSGTANDITRVLGATVWNGSIEAVKRAVLAGADLANAIQAGVDYVRDNFKGDWDENGYKSTINQAVEQQIIDTRSSDDKKLENAIKAAEKSISELERKIQEGDLSVKQRVSKINSDELSYLRERRDSLRKELNKMRRDAIKPTDIDVDAIKTPKISGPKKQDFINQVVEAYNDGKLTDDKFDQLYAKQIGYKELSYEEKQKIRELAKTINESEQFEEKVKNDFTEENIAKYKDTLAKAQKANEDLQQFARKPSNVWDTLISIMQGNLLTPLSIVVNMYSNTALQGMRFTSTAIAGVIDYSVSQLAKTANLNQAYKDRTIDLVALQEGYFKGGWNGTKEGLKQMIDGPKADDRNLREINAQFSAVRAVQRWADDHRSSEQKINDYIEGTIGWPAEIAFRLLNLGDKPFRRAAELARTMEIAKIKGLKGKDLEKFIMFPDEASSSEIDKAGKDATFQQDSDSAKVVQDILNKLMNAIGKTPYIGGPLKLLAKSQIPYVKTPWNIMMETLQYAAFPITGAVGLRQMVRGDKRNGSVLIGKAIVGAMVFAVAKELFQIGLLSWDEPYSQRAGKQSERRQIQYDNIPPNSLNVSAIQRGLLGEGFDIEDDDAWINYNKLGVMGLLFDNYTNNYFTKIKEEGIMPDQSDFWVDMLTTAPRVMSQSLDQTFLKGTNTLLTALQDGGGDKAEQWLIDTSGALSAIVYPNTLSTISKASDEYIRDVKDKDFGEKLKKTYMTKVFMGDQLPAKVNLWGQKVTGDPDGRNKMMYYLFDPTKFKNVDTNNFKYLLYNEWKKDQFNDDWLPSMPKREVTFRKVRIPLNGEQYEKLCTMIGQQRANLTSTYVNSPAFKTQDKEKKLKQLDKMYDTGRERGVKQFLMTTGWNILTPAKLSRIGKK